MIPVCEPWLTKLEEEYAAKAVASSWISGKGDYVDKFKEEISNLTGFKHVILTTTGTAACHVLAHCLRHVEGVCTVSVPVFTYIASMNALLYEGLKIKVLGIDPNTWNMSNKMEAGNTVPFPTYLYGQTEVNIPHDYADAAQAFLPDIGKKLKAASFSFFANKLIATGQGGAFCTNEDAIYNLAKMFINHYHISNYYHDGLGNNYSMSNVNAAIGCAQISRYEEIRAGKARVMTRYDETVGEFYKTQRVDPANKWMYAIRVNDAYHAKLLLQDEGIEARLSFTPLHKQGHVCTSLHGDARLVEDLTTQTLILPSSSNLSTNDQDKVIRTLFTLRENFNAIKEARDESS